MKEYFIEKDESPSDSSPFEPLRAHDPRKVRCRLFPLLDAQHVFILVCSIDVRLFLFSRLAFKGQHDLGQSFVRARADLPCNIPILGDAQQGEQRTVVAPDRHRGIRKARQGVHRCEAAPRVRHRRWRGEAPRDGGRTQQMRPDDREQPLRGCGVRQSLLAAFKGEAFTSLAPSF
eukprot:CAMPEP_0178992862 /NCGR_PEP_ID=MMETSP0795-20121207/6362_1 /TAXON_ID=88552 /ORGANISM="Amoebophrya sp., Strain Ameob2" /LENGTH=174 /DNA_ID=CAMNT_0020684815 /DNA_START=719 /DNA_END=1244 /DNA_ORIENTATION=+